MEEIDIAVITKRSIHGVFALVSRTFLIQIIGFAVNFFLYIFLSPAVIGVYFVVSAVIAFLQYFSDIGLAGALIQKKEALTDEDLRTTFTIQQSLVVSICVLALLISPFISKFYKLDNDGIVLFQALVISFFLSSLKTIPSIILERDLRFEKLVVPQIVETFFFNIVVLICAIKGFGVASFSFAVVARGVSGLIAMYIISPWKIRLGYSNLVAKKLLSFGIPFQANSLLALIKDDALIAYVGKVLPIAQVGYIGFAQKWAFTPLRLIMDNVIRITFPSFSRLQHDETYLGKAVEKSLFILSFLIFPAIMGMIVLFPYFLSLVPKYQKWEPAYLSLSFFGINAVISSISTPLTNALNAIGKIKISLYFMLFWTIITWILTPLFILWYGFNGFALASAVIAASVVFVVYVSKKFINFSLVKTTLFPLISTIIMGIAVYFSAKFLATNLIGFVCEIILGGIIYFAAMYFLAKKQLLADMALIREQFTKK